MCWYFCGWTRSCIPLEDSDLIKALEDYPNMGVDAIENILASKYEQIVFEK